MGRVENTEYRVESTTLSENNTKLIPSISNLEPIYSYLLTTHTIATLNTSDLKSLEKYYQGARADRTDDRYIYTIQGRNSYWRSTGLFSGFFSTNISFKVATVI